MGKVNPTHDDVGQSHGCGEVEADTMEHDRVKDEKSRGRVSHPENNRRGQGRLRKPPTPVDQTTNSGVR